MARGRIHVGEDGEIDAVDLHAARDQRAHDLVVAAGQRQASSFFAMRSPLVSRRDCRQFGGIVRQAVAAPDHVQVRPQQQEIITVNLARVLVARRSSDC